MKAHTNVGHHFALSSCVVAALLVGCGETQTPMGAPAALQQGRMNSTRATNSDLLYVLGGDKLFVLSYPSGQLLMSASVSNASQICSDREGNVFVTLNTDQIAEYAHGGTTPIKTLSDPESPVGCSADPTTGNLAVANLANVAIYEGSSGSPRTLTDPNFTNYFFCGYDNAGNLFVDGNGLGPSYEFRLAELPKGSSTFTDITLDKPVPSGTAGSVQWDGKLVAVGIDDGRLIYRVAGSSGHVVGTVSLRTRKPAFAFWIQANRVISRAGERTLGVWKYPAGRKPIDKIAGFPIDQGGLWAETVSVEP